jgi:hypothetical protein
MSKALHKLAKGKTYARRPTKPLPQATQPKHPVVHKAAAELSVRMLVLLKRKGWRIVEDPGAPDAES